MTGDNAHPDGGPAGSTAALAAFAAQTPLASIPTDVVERTNDVLVDSVACLLAGYSIDLGTIAVEFARDQGGPPEARILGSDASLGCAAATFANAELMNAVDFDEVLLNWGHVVPFVFPPAIAVAERVGASGRDLLRALAIGYDVAASVTSALAGPVVLNGAPPELSAGHLPVYGFSANALGAAASAGALLGLDAERMALAFGIAGYNTPVGNAIKLTASTPVPMTKYGCAGWIAQAGLTASLLAARGFTGDPCVLEGPYGLWRMLGSPRWAGEALVAELGSRWWIRDTSFKPYPCCRFLHHAMDLIAALVEEHRIDPDAIERMVVGLTDGRRRAPCSGQPGRATRWTRPTARPTPSPPAPMGAIASRSCSRPRPSPIPASWDWQAGLSWQRSPERSRCVTMRSGTTRSDLSRARRPALRSSPASGATPAMPRSAPATHGIRVPGSPLATWIGNSRAAPRWCSSQAPPPGRSKACATSRTQPTSVRSRPSSHHLRRLAPGSPPAAAPSGGSSGRVGGRVVARRSLQRLLSRPQDHANRVTKLWSHGCGLMVMVSRASGTPGPASGIASEVSRGRRA